MTTRLIVPSQHRPDVCLFEHAVSAGRRSMSRGELYRRGRCSGPGSSATALLDRYVMSSASCALTHSPSQCLRSLLPSPAVAPSCPPSAPGRLPRAPDPRLLQLVPALEVAGLLASLQASSPLGLLFFSVLLVVDCLFSKRLSVTFSNTRKTSRLFLIVDDGFFF